MWIDLNVYQGASFNAALTLVDVNKNPINLANTTIVGTIKKNYITSNVVANFQTTVPNTAQGVIYYSLSWGTTSNIAAPYRYVYDIITLNTTTNTATRVLEGTLYLNPAVSVTP